MTKFEQKSFSTPANSRAFVDNWDSVFGEEPLAVDPLCSQCREPRVLNEWPRGFCKIECERAYYEALVPA